MVEIKIYVVTTNLSKTEPTPELEQLKGQLCNAFGGLTVINNCEGYWLNNNKILEYDNVQIWEILSSTVVSPQQIMKYGEDIKRITSQKSQLITINGHPYFV